GAFFPLASTVHTPKTAPPNPPLPPGATAMVTIVWPSGEKRASFAESNKHGPPVHTTVPPETGGEPILLTFVVPAAVPSVW
ncbi:MAG TPA: hypothetical protein VMU57_01585, partial [Edaphobacter sp.]|nr:hypothetical protein [Edaphobacter sp.]